MKKYDVFISHKSQDKDQLLLLEEHLEKAGYSYWSDSKMREGENWTNQIDQAISESKIMIVLLSQYVIDDPDNMEAEIVSATQHRLKFIVVKLDDSLLSDYKGVFNLYLKKVQWINAKNDITKTFKTIDVSIQMNLSIKEDKKEELNEELKIELARLAKKQKEDYEKDIQNRVLESLFDISILKIKNLISEKLYSQALSEIESLLRTNNSWKVHEQKLICLTKNFTCFDQSVYNELDVIKRLAPEEEFIRIDNTIKEKKADIKRALQQEQHELELKAQERKKEKKAYLNNTINEKKEMLDEINEKLSIKKYINS